MKAPLAVGDIIDAQCTKCKRVTNHIVVALVGDKPANVNCNTCGGVHRYRRAAPAVKAPKAKTSAPAVKPEEWSAVQSAINSIVPKDYDMDASYRVGSVIRHSSYGLGMVQRMAGNRKMEILFESGKKVLRCK